MRRHFKRWWLLVAVTVLIALVTAGVTTAGEEVDLSRRVRLTGYLLGTAPHGMPEVMDELNKKLLRDINATMEIKYIGWGEMQSKYPLVLAAGVDIDWIYTANWAFYFQEAAKGAFYELTEEMLQKYMPRHYEDLDPVAYNEANVNGRLYMIPTATPDRKVGVVAIRGDLRKKYGVPEIKRFSDIEPYLAAVKENESGMTPMYLDSQYDIYQPLGALFVEQGDYYTDILFTTGAGSGLFWNLQEPRSKAYYLMEEPIHSGLKKAAAIMKSWYDQGYINRDVFANKVRSKESFIHGRSAIAIGNSIDIQATIASANQKGWEVELIPIVDAHGNYLADPHINNGVALAARTRNPERTLMALDLMLQEPSYNYLVYYGIEGKNYIIEDGMISLPKGVTADSNTYPPDAAGFWFTNKDQFLPLAEWCDLYIEHRNEVPNYLKSHPMAVFPVNTDNVKTEVSNCNQAFIQYFHPIYAGMIKDVDSAFETLDQRLKAAGVERLQEEFQKQMDEFYKAYYGN